MIVFCEECGEKYVIETEEIKDSAMIFICRGCNDIIRIPVQETNHQQRKQVKSEAENI